LLYLLLPKYYYADQIKENEVGRTCGMHGRGEECVQGFDGKARREETTWKTKAEWILGRLVGGV
jgi:hypothetical protein